MQVEGAGRGLRFPWEHQLLGWRQGGGWSTPRLRREIPSVTCQPQGDGGLGGRQALPGGGGWREGTAAGGWGEPPGLAVRLRARHTPLSASVSHDDGFNRLF